MVPQLPLLLLSLVAATVDAALFPKSSKVQQVDGKDFKAALKDKTAFIAAFVAPWCGHCQKLAPELTRAADGLHPLVPIYAVDCDAEKNKRVCAEQGVQGFPTIKFFPGPKKQALDFDGTRTASSIFYWASQNVPQKVQRTQNADGVRSIVSESKGKVKAVLMNRKPKVPLLWKALSNKYGDSVVFGNCRDRKGKESKKLGMDVDVKGDKNIVLMYGAHDSEPVLYEGIMKFQSLSDFFDSVINGTVDVSKASQKAKEEVLAVPEDERADLDDEARIGDAGYGGFDPHEGLDMDELLKYGNPHAGFGGPPADASAASSSNAEKKIISTGENDRYPATAPPAKPTTDPIPNVQEPGTDSDEAMEKLADADEPHLEHADEPQVPVSIPTHGEPDKAAGADEPQEAADASERNRDEL